MLDGGLMAAMLPRVLSADKPEAVNTTGRCVATGEIDRAAFYWDDNGPWVYINKPGKVKMVGAALNDRTPFTLVGSLACRPPAFLPD